MVDQEHFMIGFHGRRSAETLFGGTVKETKETKYLIIRERDVRYRFFPHLHPYVGKLAQRLLQTGTSGLQAADTHYEPGAVSLPYSIEISAGNGTTITVPSGSPVVLSVDVGARLADGTPVDLVANSQVRLNSNVDAPLPGGMKATLVEGMTDTPSSGASQSLTTKQRAVLLSDAAISLTVGRPILLADGSAANLAAPTQVMLRAESEIEIPAGTQVTFLKSARRPVLFAEIFTPTRYDPDPLVVRRSYPVKDLDFTSSGAYAVYNWELFFHVPLTLAIHLSKNQRFAEAQHWFHYLFDPTDSSEGPTPQRFWKVRPFQTTDVEKVEEILVNLATNADPTLRNDTIRNIEAWKDAPFRPHVIARYRQQAYMYKTVMAYLDNLIAWGDSLFRQDTGEAIDEALMLYVLAANILGPRPQAVPRKGSVRPHTYANLRNDLKQFGTVMRATEADLGYDLLPFPADTGGDGDGLATVRAIGKALYFSVPRNDKLLSYWDIVADRLFKIRNSLNIQGVFRQLALFEPPIDPGMLARAAAAGLDVGAIVSGLHQPLPLVRFRFLVQKAAELCQEVKSLGNSLLAAMEKEDAEAMAILRAKHERQVLEMTEKVKYGQLQEAIKAREGLLQSLGIAVQRYTFYERQLGKSEEEIQKAIPALVALDTAGIEKMKLEAQEPTVGPRTIDVDIATDLFAQVAQFLSGGKILSSHEVRETLLLELGQLATDISSILNVVSAAVRVIPQFEASVEPVGIGAATNVGGQNIGSAVDAWAAAARGIAERANFEARRASRIDAFARRERDWAFQSNLAAGEIGQIYKQVRAAEIREAVADLDLKNHRQQMKHAADIESFLNAEGTEKSGKKTNKALYAWMKREVKALYAQCFQFAFDVARKSERALQHEMGDPTLSYIQFGYLGGKEGLLAGDKLYLDIKRMEMAYHDLHQREYELTKHVSLLQTDPIALIQLRRTGRCTVSLPEALFDMDGPGHYFRRIRSVAVSIPAVAGPYTSVNCTLTLLKSSIRKTQVLRDNLYAREPGDDDRFADYFGSLQSIVTSSSQNDSGLFDTNLNDDRYLPFENSGVVSEWQLELPANPAEGEPRQFDYDTISDVILHIRYSAREGGGLLRKRAVDQLKALITAGEATGSVRLFSMRHEFPTEWAAFQTQTPAANHRYALTLTFRPEHYPFWSQGFLKSVTSVELMARNTQDRAPGTIPVANVAKIGDAGEKIDLLSPQKTLGDLFAGPLDNNSALLPKPDKQLKLFIGTKAIGDLWIAVKWSN